MTDNDEEWVEICDSEGRRASMRHLATIRYNGKTYFILSALSVEEEGIAEGELLLVREEETIDGAQEYVVADDENEIDGVVARYVTQVLVHLVEEITERDEGEPGPCGVRHCPGEFCVCGNPDLLQ